VTEQEKLDCELALQFNAPPIALVALDHPAMLRRTMPRLIAF